jgi:hypothetical protein
MKTKHNKQNKLVSSDLIDINLVKIVRPGMLEKKFRRALKRIGKLSEKYNVFMAIDYEFNTKKIALMQIMFQIEKTKFNSISNQVDTNIVKRFYILYPPELSKKTIRYLKRYAMSNLCILKILHGSEALDIPYIVDDFYQNDLFDKSYKAVNFFMSFIDTRYLCEYINLYYDKPNICKIYDLLLQYEIINPFIKLSLEQNEQQMGPIHELFIDINKLSQNKELITYAIHDVVFLVDVFKVLRLNLIKLRPKDYFILIDSLRYSFMEKRLVSNIGDDIITINSMNNYFIKRSAKSVKSVKTIKLVEVFDLVLNKYIESFDSAKYIFNINYVKANIQNLLKLILYNALVHKFSKINASNTETISFDLKTETNNLFTSLEMFEFNHLIGFLKQFDEFIRYNLFN